MAKRLPILYDNKPCYDIVFSRSFDELWTELENFGAGDKRLCIITDTNVNPLYGGILKDLLTDKCKKVSLYSFQAGEESKTLDTVREIYRFLIEEKFDRKDMLLALGGGVVGDVTGYAAATYLRGIDYVQIPTTLLAQADSSIGGKTGVDFDGFKNMVGAFKMPRLVYMNICTLQTLSDRQFFSGFAEIMKHGLIKDRSFYTWLVKNSDEICGRDPDVLEEMIIHSCSIKKSVVENDPTETGERVLLNFGHTIGHALEKAKDFQMTHGECVALGCVAAAYISFKRGLISGEDFREIRDMFVLFNLPVSVDGIDAGQIVELTRSDKKMEAGRIKFILLRKVGEAFIDRTVSEEEMLAAVNEIRFDKEDMHE